MVLHDEMPGEDANVPPLDPRREGVVKHWIELGAPGELPEKAAEHAGARRAAGGGEARRSRSGSHALRWVGQFHPLSTHFPIA